MRIILLYHRRVLVALGDLNDKTSVTTSCKKVVHDGVCVRISLLHQPVIHLIGISVINLPQLANCPNKISC